MRQVRRATDMPNTAMAKICQHSDSLANCFRVVGPHRRQAIHNGGRCYSHRWETNRLQVTDSFIPVIEVHQNDSLDETLSLPPFETCHLLDPARKNPKKHRVTTRSNDTIYTRRQFVVVRFCPVNFRCAYQSDSDGLSR